MDRTKKLILWFDHLGIEDVPLVGGKNASLGEMYRELVPKGVSVPNGFAVTAYAYRQLVEKAGIEKDIRRILQGLDTGDIKDLQKKGRAVRKTILAAKFPKKLEEEISLAYSKLCKDYGHDTDVAVRSSATAEDLPDASFAGQQETYLNIRGADAVVDACKRCMASLFTDRAISYRVDKGFDHFSIALSIGVQKMVRSDKASAGVMFTIDTESGFRDIIFVTSAYGLGENVVQGAVNPDEFHVFKTTLKEGFKPIISKKVGSKKLRMVYSEGGEKQTTRNVPVSEEDQRAFSITDSEVLELARWGTIIEDHYSRKAGRFKPMDIEWAKDGVTQKLFIVQARPETVQSRKDLSKIEEYVLKEKSELLIRGQSVGEKIGAGKAHVIKNVNDICKFKKGDVLVTEMTDPDWEPIMKIAAAIVTNRGGRTCHAAIISRELGIPCVVGTQKGTNVLKDAKEITVVCSQGEDGDVYKGSLNFEIETVNLKEVPETKTKVMLNLANPVQAFEASFLPCDGIGLAREEFVINSYIKIHPLALLNYEKIKKEGHKELIKQIDNLTYGYSDKTQFFIDKLAQGVGCLAAAFYPKDVIVRFSDFKSNEYANLIGGTLYEPKEDNPMIGWRGASRYYSKEYAPAFALECKAMKKVRGEYGLKNVKVMIPFCRTIEEGKKVISAMARNGLKKGGGLQIYVMCEIPSNVILADEFSKIFDGFSIGSNDLTQLTLGLDRDSELVSHIYDERNEAVMQLVSTIIRAAKRNHRKIGICGQAPSDFPEFADFLVDEGIDSISLNPDTLVKTKLRIAEREKKHSKK